MEWNHIPRPRLPFYPFTLLEQRCVRLIDAFHDEFQVVEYHGTIFVQLIQSCFLHLGSGRYCQLRSLILYPG